MVQTPADIRNASSQMTDFRVASMSLSYQSSLPSPALGGAFNEDITQKRSRETAKSDAVPPYRKRSTTRLAGILVPYLNTLPSKPSPSTVLTGCCSLASDDARLQTSSYVLSFLYP